MSQNSMLMRILVLSTTFIAACGQQAQVKVSFGAVTSALEVAGVSAVLEVSQDGTQVSSDEKPLSADNGVASATLGYSGVVLDKAATFDVQVIWATHANRTLLHAAKTVTSVTAGSTITIADGDIVTPDGKPDTDTDGYSDLAEVLAGTNPDDAMSKPASGGDGTVTVTVTGGGTVRFGQTQTLSVSINKGDGTSSTNPADATWAIADGTFASVAAGVVTPKSVIGQTTVTATFGGVTSSAVAVRVEPAKVHLKCEQGTGFAAGSAVLCHLWGATSAGVDVVEVPEASWTLVGSPELLINYMKAVGPQLTADGPVSITATYDDGTAAGLVDSPSWEVVGVQNVTITADVTDVTALIYHDFALSFTRQSGRPMPVGFNPPWSLKVTDSNVVYGYVKSPTVVSIQGSVLGTTKVWVSWANDIQISNQITLRSVPDHVTIVATAPVTVAAGADVTGLEIKPWANSYQGCYVSASAVVTAASASTAVATVTVSTPPPVPPAAGSVAVLNIHGVAPGSTTVTVTVNGVTSAPLGVTVP